MIRATDRHEPRAMISADLVALAFGVAVALCLETRARYASAPGIAGTSWEPIVRGSMRTTEILQKSCVALLPIFVARRIQFGGPIRAPGFLVFCVECPLLWDALLWTPALGLRRPNPAHARG